MCVNMLTKLICARVALGEVCFVGVANSTPVKIIQFRDSSTQSQLQNQSVLGSGWVSVSNASPKLRILSTHEEKIGHGLV